MSASDVLKEALTKIANQNVDGVGGFEMFRSCVKVAKDALAEFKSLQCGCGGEIDVIKEMSGRAFVYCPACKRETTWQSSEAEARKAWAEGRTYVS